MGWITGLLRCVDLIFLQETRLRPEAVPDAVTWALGCGWHSIFQPAVLPAVARPTGGAAVLARPALALARPPLVARDVGGDGLVAHGCVRAAMGLLDVFAVCLPPGGATVRTEAALDRVAAAFAGGAARSFLIGADWNAEPHELAITPVFTEARGALLATAGPTCFPTRGGDDLTSSNIAICTSRPKPRPLWRNPGTSGRRGARRPCWTAQAWPPGMPNPRRRQSCR